MTSKKIRIGCIGCGWIVEHAHIPSFLKVDDTEVVSLFDVDISRAKRLSELFKIKNVFDNVDDFFNSGIDAVIIATPNFTHAEYSLQALRRGIHVLCEKPVALYTSDVKEIIKTAQKEKVLFMPGFVNRFRYDILKIRELISSDVIGEVISIDAGWLRRAGVPRPATWFTSREHSGGGVLIDLGSHIIDICLMFFGDKIPQDIFLLTSMNYDKDDAINAAQWFTGNYSAGYHINVEDTALARIKYDMGGMITVKLSWAAPIDGDCTYFTFVGTKASIKLKTLFGFSNDRLCNDDVLVKVENKSESVIEHLDRHVNNTSNAFTGMAKYFTSAIRGSDSGYLTNKDALNCVQLIEQLYKNETMDSTQVSRISLEDFQRE